MSRIPETPSEMEAEGIPDLERSSDSLLSSDPQDAYGMEPPRDAALASDEFGTTAAEMHDGEPLDGRIAREEPDVIDLVDQPADESEGSDTPFGERAGQGVGRLVEPDEGARADTETDLVAADVGTDLGGYSAEESAMHLEPEV
ncbi:MAG: hypothetical protein QOE99_708 [Actinomycetota bacterium]|jgi:hypothetical protein|nr:hypothetical protein [Actinomycetota bacterium]